MADADAKAGESAMQGDRRVPHPYGDILDDCLQKLVEAGPAERVAVRIAERLLVLLSNEPPPTADGDLALEEMATQVAAEEAAGILGYAGGAVLSADTCAQLLAWVRTHSSETPEAQSHRTGFRLARAIALAIDETRGDSFRDEFLASGEHVVRPDRAHPVDDLLQLHWLGGASANTRPSRLPHSRPDVLPHLRLGDPVSAHVRFTIDYDMSGRLGPLALAASLRIASCHPNAALDEFDIRIDQRSFVNDGPRDRAKQVVLMKGLLNVASREGANVVVFPEYSLHWSDREEIRAHLGELDSPPLLVVGGTSAVIDSSEGTRVNEAVVWAGDREFRQAKAFPAEILSYVEAIDPEPVPRFHVFSSSGLTVAVLVCRDGAAPDVIAQLANLGTNVCLVPAFTDRLASLVGSVCSLRTLSQAFVCITNTASTLDWPGEAPPWRADAIFDGPYEAPPAPVVCPPAGPRVPGPGLWLFDSATKQAQWYPLETIPETID